MSSRRFRAVLVSLALGIVFPACHHDDSLSDLRDQQRQILAKLAALDEKIDRIAGRAAAPPRPSGPDAERAYDLPVGNSPVKGPENAPITIVEFSDYQCPFCARSEPLITEALTAYPTQARLVYKHFPLVGIHPQAMPAAIAAVAAQKQGKFWEMHDLLFANQRELAPEQIKSYARQLGLDMAKFEADLQSDEVKAAIQADMQLAQRAGVRGTPTVFVNGKLLQNRSLDGFKQLIDPMLADAAHPKTPAKQAGS
jgi:protein-disulfide isomerase